MWFCSRTQREIAQKVVKWEIVAQVEEKFHVHTDPQELEGTLVIDISLCSSDSKSLIRFNKGVICQLEVILLYGVCSLLEKISFLLLVSLQMFLLECLRTQPLAWHLRTCQCLHSRVWTRVRTCTRDPRSKTFLRCILRWDWVTAEFILPTSPWSSIQLTLMLRQSIHVVFAIKKFMTMTRQYCVKVGATFGFIVHVLDWLTWHIFCWQRRFMLNGFVINVLLQETYHLWSWSHSSI